MLLPPLKKRVGGRMGARGEGNAPCALAKGVSFPPEDLFTSYSSSRNDQS